VERLEKECAALHLAANDAKEVSPASYLRRLEPNTLHPEP